MRIFVPVALLLGLTGCITVQLPLPAESPTPTVPQRVTVAPVTYVPPTNPQPRFDVQTEKQSFALRAKASVEADCMINSRVNSITHSLKDSSVTIQQAVADWTVLLNQVQEEQQSLSGFPTLIHTEGKPVEQLLYTEEYRLKALIGAGNYEAAHGQAAAAKLWSEELIFLGRYNQVSRYVRAKYGLQNFYLPQ